MYRFVWKIKLHNPDQEDEFIEHWRKGSTILQQYPGARGTHIHRVRNEPGSFFLLAEWESQAARDAMQADIDKGESEWGKEWQALPLNESFGEIIAFAGEESGVVMPENN